MDKLWIILLLLVSVTEIMGYSRVLEDGYPSELQEIDTPQDIRVQCNKNEILINVDTAHDVFTGMIYPKGLSKNSTCMMEYEDRLVPVKYKLPIRSCNTMSTRLDNGEIEYFNTIVVQPHKKLVTNKGRGFHVRCRFRPNSDITENNKISSDLLDGKPPVTMKIYLSETHQPAVAEDVKIGDSLTIEITVNSDEKSHGLFVTDCSVQDGLGWAQQHLIDEEGCSIDSEVMGQFEYNSDLSKAVVKFQAHKFPYTASVYYQCSVHLCVRDNNECENVPPNCNQNDKKRRTRRDDRTSNNSTSDEGSQAIIEVYSGLYVNEATDLNRPEQMDQVSREKAQDDPYSICISQRSFAVGIAIAGLVLMLLTIAAILIILTKRRHPRKDASISGSSIYSGPYTNTAYSHTS